MRCISCNTCLTDFEATRKTAFTNDYVDLCNRCFRSISSEIVVIERNDLRKDIDNEDEFTKD